MKKRYINPAVDTQTVEMEALIAATQPGVTINNDESVNANAVEVKRNSGYNVWKEDWSE